MVSSHTCSLSKTSSTNLVIYERKARDQRKVNLYLFSLSRMPPAYWHGFCVFEHLEHVGTAPSHLTFFRLHDSHAWLYHWAALPWADGVVEALPWASDSDPLRRVCFGDGGEDGPAGLEGLWLGAGARGIMVDEGRPSGDEERFIARWGLVPST